MFCSSPVTISEAQRAAPEETFDPGHEKQKSEMTPDERKALRGAIKERRRKKIRGKVVSSEYNEGFLYFYWFQISSEMSVRDSVQRNLHLQEKNKCAMQNIVL